MCESAWGCTVCVCARGWLWLSQVQFWLPRTQYCVARLRARSGPVLDELRRRSQSETDPCQPAQTHMLLRRSGQWLPHYALPTGWSTADKPRAVRAITGAGAESTMTVGLSICCVRCGPHRCAMSHHLRVAGVCRLHAMFIASFRAVACSVLRRRISTLACSEAKRFARPSLVLIASQTLEAPAICVSWKAKGWL